MYENTHLTRHFFCSLIWTEYFLHLREFGEQLKTMSHFQSTFARNFNLYTLGLACFLACPTLAQQARDLSESETPPHVFYEEILNLEDHESEIQSALKSQSSSTANAVVQFALQELKEFNAGNRDRTHYGALPFLKVGPLFDWWCSEFASHVLYNSQILPKNSPLQTELGEVSRSSSLMEFFARNSKTYVKEKIANNVQAGDYLALSHAFKDTPSHSTIVVYVSSNQSFIYTIDGNNHSNDKVLLHKRQFIKNGTTPGGQKVTYINPEFLMLGKTSQIGNP